MIFPRGLLLYSEDRGRIFLEDDIYHTTQRRIPEDLNFYVLHCTKHISHNDTYVYA
jgi:hypothetical protein